MIQSEEQPPLPLKTNSPQSLLFCCSKNAVRSPMAEALAKSLFGMQLYIDSAGVENQPVDPFAVAVMQEIGIDLAQHNAKTLLDLRDAGFDLIITLSPEAHQAAQKLAETHAIEVESWDIPDPTETTGHREARLLAYRMVRDQLRRKIITRLAKWPDESAVD